MAAVVTLISALEPVLQLAVSLGADGKTQYRLHRIRDEMDYYLVTTPAADLEPSRLSAFFDDQQFIWEDVSLRWIDFRKLDRSQPGSRAAPDASTLLLPEHRN